MGDIPIVKVELEFVWVCPHCNHEERETIEPDWDIPGECSQCGGEVEFDTEPD